jgi:hypothetical protein
VKTFIVTLVGFDGPIKSEKALGFTRGDVYNMYREEYPVDQYPQIKYIDVAEIL